MAGIVITIDGPAGAGKSSAAKTLARRLEFDFLDTGAMYRAITWAAIDRNLELTDHEAVAAFAAELAIEFRHGKTLINGVDVTDEIRTPEVSVCVSEIADNPAVREQMVMLQREIADTGNFVCEGRDQGTVVFPDADCKFFLTASPAERARRRREQLQLDGDEANLELVLGQQTERDRRDRERPVGRLEIAADAIEVSSDGKTLQQVVDELERHVREQLADSRCS